MTQNSAAIVLNEISLVGRVGQEPEMRYFESGSCLCKLSLAVNRRAGKNEPPNWFPLEIWGRTAEVAANYIGKGSLIGIEGHLKLDEWMDMETGMLRSKLVVRVRALELLARQHENGRSEELEPQPELDEQF